MGGNKWLCLAALKINAQTVKHLKFLWHKIVKKNEELFLSAGCALDTNLRNGADVSKEC